MPLVESERRREGFTEGRQVKLGDGQVWTFPANRLRLYPARDADGKWYAGGGPSFGVEYEDRIEDLIALDDEAVFERLAAQYGLAADLLLLNYDLTDRDLRHLLAHDLADEASREMWEEVNGVILGHPPKPSAGGSDASA